MTRNKNELQQVAKNNAEL